MTARTLCFGFDGADHAFMDAMMAAGELPAFAALKAKSRIFNFENDAAMGAAQFWNSASIGAGPGHHGHYFYMQFKPDTYDVVPNHDSSIPDIKPFWNTLDDEGYAIAVVDWHRLQPKPLKNGLLLDNWLGHDPLTDTLYYPPALKDDAQQHFSGDIAGGGFAALERNTAEEMQAYLDALMQRIDAKTAFCIDKLNGRDWDLFIACYSEAHDVGHYFYHLCDRAHPRYDASLATKLKEPLRACYRRLDAGLAKVMAAAGDEARIFVYGGPGMEMLISANDAMEEMMRRIDLGIGAPPSVAEKARTGYRTLLPQKLRWRLAPVARALRRRFANHEYARRRFFAVPHNDNSGAVRINVKGREKHGIVARGAAYDAVLKEIAEAVQTFRNADNGRPIVKRVICVPKDYDGPHIDVLPDLFIEWDRDGAAQNFSRIVSDKYGEIDIEDPLRTGDHNASGFFWGPTDYAGPTITRPQQVTAPLMDAVRKKAAPQERAAHRPENVTP